MSTLNIFHCNSNSGMILMSTATVDIPGPQLTLPNCKYPTERTSPIYSIDNCQHNYVHLTFKQLRRGDEAPTSIQQCTLCQAIRKQ